ncbi:hypothetical protein FOA43_000860 [Brettanomyces nanus]|uniref:Mitochondrial distribution and morphology protein 34 n=1 Tax=Eeniella nana TaxID=13502 RepID=A0A875RY04_EENNA|nr:uncharacterized protein FOA43_000860 [Brettanomyces nanus]QPG73548.1 hypothetical protein FOA43_000860 [Brettanomyces nanus]
MSFKINWNCIEKDSFIQYAKDTLNEAMNSGKKPNILSDTIKIVDLNFGSIPPDFEILEIGDLGSDRFRGIFKFNYFGDASITLTTKVSASLLKNYNDNITDDLVDSSDTAYETSCRELAGFIKPNFIVSDCDFDIPLHLTLSSIKMSSIIVVVFSVSKGLTLVFKNEPLESIEVNSTFDKIKPIARFLQEKIETQIGELFKEFLPSMLYKISLEYTSQSFEQFHRSMVDDQEVEEPRVMLKDIDPDALMGISPGSLMRLTRLASSRQTLALGGELSCDRMNSNIVTKAFANAIIASSNTFAFSRLHMSDSDFIRGEMGEKVSVIKEFQKKTFFKSTHDEVRPRRRVIKLHRKKKVEPELVNVSEAAETAEVPQVPQVPQIPQVPQVPLVPQEPLEEDDDTTVMESDSSVEKKQRSMSCIYSGGSSVTSDATLNENQPEIIAIPMLRRTSRSGDSPTVDSHNGSTTYQIDERHDHPTPEQLQQLQQQLQEQWITLPAKLVQDIQAKSKNLFHIGKDEQQKIRKRIVKLDQLLSKKNAVKHDNSERVPTIYGYSAGNRRKSGSNGLNGLNRFDTPPPPYTCF